MLRETDTKISFLMRYGREGEDVERKRERERKGRERQIVTYFSLSCSQHNRIRLNPSKNTSSNDYINASSVTVSHTTCV